MQLQPPLQRIKTKCELYTQQVQSRMNFCRLHGAQRWLSPLSYNYLILTRKTFSIDKENVNTMKTIFVIHWYQNSDEKIYFMLLVYFELFCCKMLNLRIISMSCHLCSIFIWLLLLCIDFQPPFGLSFRVTSTINNISGIGLVMEKWITRDNLLNLPVNVWNF